MKIVPIIALATILSVAAIIASIGQQSAMAIHQSHNGANANSGHGTNANGGRGENGGVDGDAQKAGTGQNGGTNVIGGGSCPSVVYSLID